MPNNDSFAGTSNIETLRASVLFGILRALHLSMLANCSGTARVHMGLPVSTSADIQRNVRRTSEVIPGEARVTCRVKQQLL